MRIEQEQEQEHNHKNKNKNKNTITKTQSINQCINLLKRLRRCPKSNQTLANPSKPFQILPNPNINLNPSPNV